MVLMDLDELRRRLSRSNIQFVAEKTGFHPNTLYQIKWGQVKNIKLETLQALTDYYTAKGK